MEDGNKGKDLPQRVRGATRPGPRPSVASPSPELSDELRQRMQAAVAAERSEAAVQERGHTTGPSRRAISPAADSDVTDVTTQPAKEINGKRKQAAGPGTDVKNGRTIQPRRSAEPQRTAKPEPVARAKPEVFAEEDEITEWLSPQPTAKSKLAGPGPTHSETAAAPVQAARPVSPSPGIAKKPGRRRRGVRIATWAVIAFLAIGVLAVVAVRHFARSPGSQLSAAQQRQSAAAQNEAVAWVARHVSRDAMVSCDPVMYAALRAHGFPSRELLVLGSTSEVPVKSAVVVETPAVLSLFGSSLASAWAPDVLASFGSGPTGITVRVMATHGAVAYQTALGADQAARKTAGTALRNDSQISIPVLAENQLAAGEVDARLLLALADLAGHRPIRIVQFGNDGPGASADVPLRFVDLAENVPAAHLARAAYVNAVRAFLGQVKVNYRPASMTTVVLADGQAVLRIEFTAPSPLGVFGAPSAP
jgi:hypothetical protein